MRERKKGWERKRKGFKKENEKDEGKKKKRPRGRRKKDGDSKKTDPCKKKRFSLSGQKKEIRNKDCRGKGIRLYVIGDNK